MKYTIAKMFQILRHNRWVSILMIIEIALGMSVFTYSLNMFFSLSREKENQKNQERDLVLEISGGEGMNDIEKQAFTLKWEIYIVEYFRVIGRCNDRNL